MNYNNDEPMYIIAFEDCLHTMIKPYKFVKHAGNTGEDQFTGTVSNPSAAAPGRQ